MKRRTACTKTTTKTRGDSCSSGGRGQHQTGPLKPSKGDVDPIAILKPHLPLLASVDDFLPEAQNPSRWVLGTHEVGAKAKIPNEPKIWERLLPEKRIDLFDQWEKRCVQVVIVIGKFGVEEAGINIANRDELKGGVGRKEDVRSYPVGGFPMPLGVRGADELSKVWTPISERDRCHVAGIG